MSNIRSLKLLVPLLAVMAAIFIAANVGAGKHEILSPRDAYEMASRGEILLIDIRRPSEWRETGVATSANTISMHQPGFEQKLKSLLRQNGNKPIALICAAGVRSRWMQSQLLARGYKNVIDVSEGMIGGRNGRGWINSGLPIKSYDE